MKLVALLSHPSSRKPGRQEAQGMVEFALVLSILLMVIYGLFEAGRLIFVYSTVVLASREAVRYGSATGLNVASGVPRYTDCIGIRAAAQNVDFLGAFDDANILITYDKGPGVPYVPPVSCPFGDTTGGPSPTQINTPPLSRIKVQVSGSFTPLSAIVPLRPITITSSNARTIIGSVQLSP
jgi:Flp pilus assembly protein TadG